MTRADDTPNRPTDAPRTTGARDPHVDYVHEHTAADPATVRRENRVDNNRKALPSQKGTAYALAFGGAAIALVAVLLEWLDVADVLALVLAIVAVAMTAIATFMAWNDARAGVGAPILCLVVSSIVLAIILLDVLEVDDRVREAADPETNVVAPVTADPDAIPADPAEIEPDEIDTGAAAVTPEEARAADPNE